MAFHFEKALVAQTSITMDVSNTNCHGHSGDAAQRMMMTNAELSAVVHCNVPL